MPEDAGSVRYSDDVLRISQVKTAIHDVFSAFFALEATVTECIYTIRAVDASFRGLYPELYGIIESDFLNYQDTVEE